MFHKLNIFSEPLNKFLLRGFLSAIVVGGIVCLYLLYTGNLMPAAMAQQQAVNPELKGTAGPEKPAQLQVDPVQTQAAGLFETPATPTERKQEAEAKATAAAGNREGLQRVPDVTRIQSKAFFAYSPTSIYEIFCHEGHLTDIQLQAGEDIQYIGGGDTVRWVVDKAPSGAGDGRQWHIYIKPLRGGLVTNFIITTDRRAYQIRARSSSFYNPIIGWTYPHDEKMAFLRQQAEQKKKEDEQITPAVSPDKMNFNYKISEKSGLFGGSFSWTPKMVFDDGTKTYIQMSDGMSSGEAPALFVKDDSGLALVNYRVKDNYYIVDRLFQKAEMKNGMEETVVITRSRRGI